MASGGNDWMLIDSFEGKKKKKSKTRKQKRQNEIEREMEFEVIGKEEQPQQAQREFEVIPPQNIRLLDTNPLNVCEDYFSSAANSSQLPIANLNSKNNSNKNTNNSKKKKKRNGKQNKHNNRGHKEERSDDSDIEIVSKMQPIVERAPPGLEEVTRVKKISLESVETGEEAMEEEEETENTLVKDSYSGNDDSDIEVVGQAFTESSSLLNLNQHHEEIDQVETLTSCNKHQDDDFQIEFRDDSVDHGTNGGLESTKAECVDEIIDENNIEKKDKEEEKENVEEEVNIEEEQDLDDGDNAEDEESMENETDASDDGESENSEAEDEYENDGNVDMTQSFGLNSLFDSFYQKQSNESSDIEIVALKTSTLVFVFCLSIIVGVSLGTGFGSLVAFKSPTPENKEGGKSKTIEEESLAGSANPSSERFLYLNSDGEFSATRRTIKEMLTSFRKLERDYQFLKVGYDEYKHRYELQKSMMWYWRKQAKTQRTVVFDHPTRIDDGLMVRYCDNNNTNDEKVDDDVISNLTNQLIKERELVNYWKAKYTSLKLSKIRTCAKIGKSMAPSSFSFSGCLMVFSNAIPDLNISSSLLNISSPVERISGHVQKAWSNLKNRWREDASLNSNKKRYSTKAKQFRKMLTIGNLVNSVDQKKQPPPTTEIDDGLSFCPGENFEEFLPQWKIPSESPRKPLTAEESTSKETPQKTPKKTKRQYKVIGPDSSYSQPKDDNEILPPKPCAGKNTEKSREKKNVEPPRSPNDFLRPNSIFMNDLIAKHNEERNWLKKKLDDVTFLFDVYKWEMDAKVRSAKQELRQHVRLQNEYRKNRVKNLKKQKRELVEKINELKEKTKYKNTAERKRMQQENEQGKGMIRKLNHRIAQLEYQRQYWEETEKVHATEKIRKMEHRIKEQKNKFKAAIHKLKKKFKHHIKKEKQKLEYENKNHQILKLKNDKATRKLSYYKNKYNQSKQEKEHIRAMYLEMKELQQHSKDIIEHLERKLKDYRKIVRDSKRRRKEKSHLKKNKKLPTFRYLEQVSKSWRSCNNNVEKDDSRNHHLYPTVYCPDGNNCQPEAGNSDSESMTHNNDYHLSVLQNPPFEVTKFTQDEEVLFTSQPKAQPPLELKPPFFPPKPEPPKSLKSTINIPWNTHRNQRQPLKPSPPRGLKGEPIHQSNVTTSDETNEADETEEDPVRYSWYFARVAGRNNKWDSDADGTEDSLDNWYLKMMNLRDTYREEPDDYNQRKVNQLNWYIKAMNDREKERDDWYVKWMENRRKD